MSGGCWGYREQQLRELFSGKLALFHCPCQTQQTSIVVHHWSVALYLLGFNSTLCGAARMSYLRLHLCLYWILIAFPKKPWVPEKPESTTRSGPLQELSKSPFYSHARISYSCNQVLINYESPCQAIHDHVCNGDKIVLKVTNCSLAGSEATPQERIHAWYCGPVKIPWQERS